VAVRCARRERAHPRSDGVGEDGRGVPQHDQRTRDETRGGADGGPWRPRGLRLAAARLGERPLVAVEAWARRLVPLPDLSAGERREALPLLVRLVRRVGQRPSIRVETWDGAPTATGEVAGDLAALGFIRDDQAMVLYRSFRGSV
jgi:hypothetical protein